MPAAQPLSTRRVLAGLVIALTILIAITLSGVFGRKLYLQSRKTHTINEMQLLMRSLVTFNQSHSSLPPAITAKASGAPLSSWRLALSGVMFGMSQPPDLGSSWLSSENRRHSDVAVDVLSHKGDRNVKFACVCCEDCAFDNYSSRNLADCPSSLVLTVSTTAICANWCAPADFRFDELERQAQNGMSVGEAFGLTEGRFVGILFANGEILLVRGNAPLSVVVPLCSVRTTSDTLVTELKSSQWIYK